MQLRFYVGLHQPSDARRFDLVFMSVNRLRGRKKRLGAGAWIMDSGAFTEISQFGRYRHSVKEYTAEILRWVDDPALVAVVSQDWMCEAFILEKTGLSIGEHQRLTIERYDALQAIIGARVTVMPVLQGYAAADYVAHLAQYGSRLARGQYVGVGSVCKRNTNVGAILEILRAIKAARPDLRLHGFGLKTTALRSPDIRHLLYSADSMAWSFSARKQGRSGNDWREARRFVERLRVKPEQLALPLAN